jgi:hypothetical protein
LLLSSVSGAHQRPEDIAKARQAARIVLIATATNAAVDTAVNPDGTFTFPKVFPGQYQNALLLQQRSNPNIAHRREHQQDGTSC